MVIMKTKTSSLEDLVFWTERLLMVAKELQSDLKRFYSPEKGWPPHIEVLEGTTDFSAAIREAKDLIERDKENYEENGITKTKSKNG